MGKKISLTDRLAQLEERVAALEVQSEQRALEIRGNIGHGLKRHVEWILGYLLKRAKEEDVGPYVLPKYSDRVFRILNTGSSQGYSKAKLRLVRKHLEPLVEVTHAPESKDWIWVLKESDPKKWSKFDGYRGLVG